VCLQRVLVHVLEAAEGRTSTSSASTKVNCRQQWVEAVAQDLDQTLSHLGPGESGSEDKDDTEAWLCLSRSIRLLSTLEYATSTTTGSATAARTCARDLVLALSSRVVERALGIGDWTTEVEQLFAEWKLPDKLRSERRWKVLASSYLSIAALSLKFQDSGAPMALAVVEISHLCLQTAMIELAQQSIENNDSDYDDDETDEPLQYESTCIYTALEQLEAQYQSLGQKSRGLVLSNSHLLRLNYYVNCIRQYPRLEKHVYHKVPTGANLQSTLDTWVSTD